MGADLALDIEIRVSDELRDLLQARRLAPRDTGRPAAQPQIMVGMVADPASPEDAPDWQPILLRQDGARPLQFRGALLLECCKQVDGPPDAGEIRIALYLGESGQLCAGLSVEPGASSTGRPIYRAAILRDGADLSGLLGSLAPETCLETTFVTDTAARDLVVKRQHALRSAFTSMAAECPIKGFLPA